MFWNNLERYRVVRRPPFKSGAAVHVEHADPCGQCSSWSMLIRVASAAVGACRSVWPVQHLEHADLRCQWRFRGPEAPEPAFG